MLKGYSSIQLIRELLNRGFSVSHFQKNFGIESLKHDGQPPYLVSTNLYSEYENASAFADIEFAMEALWKKFGYWTPTTETEETNK
jgi:hypothetical protein